MLHDHFTRVIKPPGECLACDEYHRKLAALRKTREGRALELRSVRELRDLAKGMSHRGSARKADLIDWLRNFRPEVENPPCSEFQLLTNGVCGVCGRLEKQHAKEMSNA